MLVVLCNTLGSLTCVVQLNQQTSNLAEMLTQKCQKEVLFHQKTKTESIQLICQFIPSWFELVIKKMLMLDIFLHWNHVGIHSDLHEGVIFERQFRVNEGWPPSLASWWDPQWPNLVTCHSNSDCQVKRDDYLVCNRSCHWETSTDLTQIPLSIQTHAHIPLHQT